MSDAKFPPLLPVEPTPPRLAPPGFVWVCVACGKTARDRYGIEGEHSPGWDESCMLNSELVEESRIVRGNGGRIVRVDEVAR